MKSKVFRLFVSSTFDDFRRERETLQTYVFPKIREYCSGLGYVFQPIDLRWGINSEAQYNQKTLELCLNEVRICKTYPYPNFLLMLGDRYGWIPLPYAIEREEWLTIVNHTRRVEKELLEQWYTPDLNQLPPSYVLRERTDRYIPDEAWNGIEADLRLILQKAVKKSALSEAHKRKYFTSATEAEVIEGVFAYGEETKHQQELRKEHPELLKQDARNVFAFIRDTDPESKISDKFIAGDHHRAREFKNNVKAILPPENLLLCSTAQVDENTLDNSYIIAFADGVISFLEEKISEFDRATKSEIQSHLAVELEAQTYFLEQKRKCFIGQADVLQRIAAYIEDDGQTEPLVLYGRSGIGKSAIMAQAIHNSILKGDNVAYRFVGATPDSYHINGLLISVFEEMGLDVRRDSLPEVLRKMNPDHVSEDFYGRASLEEFSQRIVHRFGEVQGNHTIFIDAVDQLAHDDRFLWLPEKLPVNVKIIISVFSEDEQGLSTWQEKDIDFKTQIKQLHLSLKKMNDHESYFNNLLIRTKNICFIGNYRAPVALLRQLLKNENRTIRKEQEAYFLRQFQRSPTPLYIYVAAQELKHWKSFELTEEEEKGGRRLPAGQEDIVRYFLDNLTAVYFHSRTMVQKVLGFIYASRDGLSEREILELLATDQDFIKAMAPDTWHQNLTNDLPLIIWTRLYENLKPFLSKKNQLGEELLHFYHREFERAIVDNSRQIDEHESIILATQQILLRQYRHNRRLKKLYIYLVARYQLAYRSKLKEHSVFIAESGISEYWIDQNYLNYLLLLSDSLRLHNLEERELRYVYLLSAAYTTEALYHKDPDRWLERYLTVLPALTEVYERMGMSENAVEIAAIALSVVEPCYERNPGKFTETYLNRLYDLAWSNREIDERKALDLFIRALTITKELCESDPDKWSKQYVRNLTALGLLNRRKDNLAALEYHREALNVAERQLSKFPRKWEKAHKRCRANFNSFYNYEISISDKLKYRFKRFRKGN